MNKLLKFIISKISLNTIKNYIQNQNIISIFLNLFFIFTATNFQPLLYKSYNNTKQSITNNIYTMTTLHHNFISNYNTL
jgi:hypothetical protein